MNEQELFDANDEPITIQEIADRLREPNDKLRRTLRELRRRAPHNEILQPLPGTVRKQYLSAGAANRLARAMRKSVRKQTCTPGTR